MVASCHFSHSPVTSVTAPPKPSKGDLKRILNSHCASSSSDSSPFVASSSPYHSQQRRNRLGNGNNSSFPTACFFCNRHSRNFKRGSFENHNHNHNSITSVEAAAAILSLSHKKNPSGGGWWWKDFGRGLRNTSSNFGSRIESAAPFHSLGIFEYRTTISSRHKKNGNSVSSLRCSASDETVANNEKEVERSIELPLFPLPLVLFPGAILPLQIFEFRYRIMMHTLLQTDLRFGVVYTDKTTGLAAVGCVGEVIKHERLVDDRFFMICKGQERFRVMGIVRTKPYLVARVEWLEDRPSGEQEDVEALANEVETYMKDVIRLSNRVNGKPEKAAPEDLRKKLFPTPFSFWVGSTFEGAPVEQQALLELEDTAQRLKREKETLRNTLNYLSAASAVKDAFPSAE
ncbi:unnamed protein product [Calypogeia fissa]